MHSMVKIIIKMRSMTEKFSTICYFESFTESATTWRILLASGNLRWCVSINQDYLGKSRMYSSKRNTFRFSTNLNNSRAMSMSAPSAINTDFTTVKFDDETTEWNNTGTSQAKSAMSHR